MFTGLVEKVVQVEDFILTSNGAKITFDGDFDTKIGDSVAVNGACLTISNIKNSAYALDIMKETLSKTNLKDLKKGSLINIERAMKLTDRLDGHIVTGHIDNIADVVSICDEGIAKRVGFCCNTDLIVEKGSIAINGVSLTVCNVQKDYFEVSLIPLTIQNTNLVDIKISDKVNIEYDIIAKYIKKFTSNNENSKITMEFLKQNGF